MDNKQMERIGNVLKNLDISNNQMRTLLLSIVIRFLKNHSEEEHFIYEQIEAIKSITTRNSN